MNPEMTIENLQGHIGNARELRELLSADPHRPRYHLLPPEGFFNDANCNTNCNMIAPTIFRSRTIGNL